MKSETVYESCTLCPRACAVNRRAGERGFCGETAALRVASASIHRGEEPPITGDGGSGTIFITGCNVRCSFCQNYQISRDGLGRDVSSVEFAALCCELERRGAENINIVTGSHAVPAILDGLREARVRGLSIPALWNSSGYESTAAISLLDGAIDAFLPDLKTLDSGLSERFCGARDYPEAAVRAISLMMEMRPRKVLIRHLVLPGLLESTRAVLRWFARNAKGRAGLSLMTQYTPVFAGGTAENTELPRRFLNKDEYETVLRYLDEFGIEDGYYQELETDSDWLPDFTRENPFSSALSTPVWHFSAPPLNFTGLGTSSCFIDNS